MDSPTLIRILSHDVALIINPIGRGTDGTRKTDCAEVAPPVKEPERRAAQLVESDNVAESIDVRGYGCVRAGEINGGKSASAIQEALLRVGGEEGLVPADN